MPKDASPELALKWRALFRELREIKLVLDRVEKDHASCKSAPSSDACVAAREAAAQDLYETTHRARRMVYVCKPKAAEVPLAERSNAEAKVVHERVQKLEAAWQAAVGENEWNAAMDRARGAKAVPCLSFSCKEWM